MDGAINSVIVNPLAGHIHSRQWSIIRDCVMGDVWDGKEPKGDGSSTSWSKKSVW